LEFLISTIPGKPPKALAQIASGGELSRISLAIAVVTAQTSNIPTVVFDEVDVGIGGGVAEVVGNLLRELGQQGQVFCVTHLAQVAAKGDIHLLAKKSVTKNGATTSVTNLMTDRRTAELARMMGGLDVTESSIAHAAEMLEGA
jgi:DNA repair protein RecN (Recombination protein N)